MIQINELRITPDNKCLIIDTQIEDIEYFENVTIDSIFVDTQDTWVPNGPSNKAIKVYSQPEQEPIENVYVACGKIYTQEDDEEVCIENPQALRHIRLELQKPIISTDANTMYFVYVIADVSKAPEYTQAPCTCSNERIMSTVVNTYQLYNTMMDSIKEVANDCSDCKNFIDSYLRLQVVESSIKAGNYPTAIKYWKKFFMRDAKIKNFKPCGCNG